MPPPLYGDKPVLSMGGLMHRWAFILAVLLSHRHPKKHYTRKCTKMSSHSLGVSMGRLIHGLAYRMTVLKVQAFDWRAVKCQIMLETRFSNL